MLDSAYVIGHRKLLSDQPYWRQWPVRFVNWLVGWNGGPEVHGITITFSKDRAIQLSSKRGWFKWNLPIDGVSEPLPEQTVRYGDNDDQFPLSEQTFIYQRGDPMEAKPLKEIEEEHSAVTKLIEQADRIRHKAQAATASL